jgi:hypothetical protein
MLLWQLASLTNQGLPCVNLLAGFLLHANVDMLVLKRLLASAHLTTFLHQYMRLCSLACCRASRICSA